MERQNITLSLPKVLLKKVRAVAAQEEKSVSEFLRESLENKIRQTNGFRKAKSRQIKFLQQGFNLGTRGHICITRGKLHDR
ncbi:MAG: ribbon-helix-helix protein, CopG family [Desulfobacteraceae bacterium]|nr:MAG: ribbon-helix-helix protein, CopG family [Desulfobacteraceae bacterium]